MLQILHFQINSDIKKENNYFWRAQRVHCHKLHNIKYRTYLYVQNKKPPDLSLKTGYARGRLVPSYFEQGVGDVMLIISYYILYRFVVHYETFKFLDDDLKEYRIIFYLPLNRSFGFICRFIHFHWNCRWNNSINPLNWLSITRNFLRFSILY